MIFLQKVRPAQRSAAVVSEGVAARVRRLAYSHPKVANAVIRDLGTPSGVRSSSRRIPAVRRDAGKSFSIRGQPFTAQLSV
jgi:hypothetical protein